MSEGYQSHESPNDATSDYNAMHFLIRTIAGKFATSTSVQVRAVHQVAPFEYEVDVQVLVHQTDGLGNVTPHGIIYGLPVARQQGGNGAVILVPAVGDIGMASFSREDMTAVRANRSPSPPGSGRRYSYSDGVYMLSILNAAPTRYMMIGPEGTQIVDPVSVTVNTPMTIFTGDIQTAAGSTFNGKSFDSHTHGGVQTGSGTSGPPS